MFLCLTLLFLYQDYFEKTVFLVFSSQFSVYFTLMLMQSSFVFMRSFDRNNGLVRTLIHHPYYISPSTAFVFGPEVSLCQRCVRRAKITSLCAAQRISFRNSGLDTYFQVYNNLPTSHTLHALIPEFRCAMHACVYMCMFGVYVMHFVRVVVFVVFIRTSTNICSISSTTSSRMQFFFNTKLQQTTQLCF